MIYVSEAYFKNLLEPSRSPQHPSFYKERRLKKQQKNINGK